MSKKKTAESERLKEAKDKALKVFLEWNDVTGAVPRHTGWYYELESVIEDAVEIGAKANGSENKEAPASELKRIVRLRKATITHYWSGDHIPYRFRLRDSETDENFNLKAELEDAFKNLAVEDGDEIEIVVRKTGNRPFGDRKVRLVEPHTYKREPDAT